MNCRSIQCYGCKMFGHKASLCRNHVVNQNYNPVAANKKSYNFQGHCCNCNNYGHKANQCKYRFHPVRFEKKIASCFKCNQPRHYANQCRKGNEEKPVKKSAMKNDESKKKENLVWRKKNENEGSKLGVPEFDAGTPPSGN